MFIFYVKTISNKSNASKKKNAKKKKQPNHLTNHSNIKKQNKIPATKEKSAISANGARVNKHVITAHNTAQELSGQKADNNIICKSDVLKTTQPSFRHVIQFYRFEHRARISTEIKSIIIKRSCCLLSQSAHDQQCRS